MRAFAAEWRRLFHRRALGWLTMAMIVISALVAVSLWYAYRPPPPAELAQLNADYQAALTDFNQHKQRYIDQCLVAQTISRQTDPSFDGNCTEAGLRPVKGWTSPDLQTLWDDILGSIGPTLAGFLTLILGATLIAAEYSSGNLATWLTVEGRRGRVYLTKLIAAAVGGVFISLIGLAVMLAGAWGAVRLDHGTHRLASDYWLTVLAPRVTWDVGLVAGAGVLAAGLTFLVRRFWATLALLAGYFVVVEVVLARFLPLIRPYTLGNAVLALAGGSRQVAAAHCTLVGTIRFQCQVATAAISPLWAGVGLSGLLLLVVLLGWLVFRRRDVAS